LGYHLLAFVICFHGIQWLTSIRAQNSRSPYRVDITAVLEIVFSSVLAGCFSYPFFNQNICSDAFKALQEESTQNGTSEMTMEDIDAEIAAYRQEKRSKK